jgi:DNA-binding MarR family transcriptional regulator
MSSVARGEGGGRPEAGGAVSGERGPVPGEQGAVPGQGGAMPGEQGAVRGKGGGAVPGERGVVPTDGGAVSAAVDAARARRRLITTIKESMRAMSTQLSLLNHHVGARIELKDVDLNCLDLLARHGPLSPTALAKRAGLHPATMTGILDRLERGGWVVRDRDPDASDRRAVRVRPLRERGADLYRLYSGMNASLDEICAGYDDAELELLAGFLRRTTEAGQSAAADLAEG